MSGNGHAMQHATGTVLVVGPDGIAVPVGAVDVPWGATVKAAEPQQKAAPKAKPPAKRKPAPKPKVEHDDDEHRIGTIRSGRVADGGDTIILSVWCQCGRVGDIAVSASELDEAAVDWDP